MNYFSSIELTSAKQQNEDETRASRRLLGDDIDDKQLNMAKWAWSIGQQAIKEHCSEYGRTFQVDLSDHRFFLVHEPPRSDDRQRSLPLLVFYHGLNSCAWYCALVRTRWIELAAKFNFLVVFGQGQGTFYPNGPQRDQYGHLGFGDLYWEIEQPKDDFNYLDSLLNYMKKNYPDRLDEERIYFMGYSNGALFSSNVAVHYGGRTFAALCNHCGGFGGQYNEDKMLQPRDIVVPLPIYILTGVNDAYKESCLKAKHLFEVAQCPINIDIVQNRGHTYYADMEEHIWTKFFLKHVHSKCTND